MARQSHLKMERIVEAVRQGFEGDDTIEFLHQSGYAISSSGVARHLKKLGGRGAVESQIEAGNTNLEILERVLADEDVSEIRPLLPASSGNAESDSASKSDAYEFETTKLTVNLPTDLYEAIRAAAHAEKKNHNQLIVDLLTRALSQIPVSLSDDSPED